MSIAFSYTFPYAAILLLAELKSLFGVYLKKNDDWTNKLKYGYVYGNKDKLIQRLNDSREEHSEKSEFIKIFTFNKNNNYCLVYKEIDKIFSLFLNWKKILKIF